MNNIKRSQDLLKKWFGPLSSWDRHTSAPPKEKFAMWFFPSDEVRKSVDDEFGDLPELYLKGELDSWKESLQGKLSIILVLDQISRNGAKDSADAFKYDNYALEISKELVENGEHSKFTLYERAFIYLPFEHSEDLALQDKSVELYTELEELGKGINEEVHKTAVNFLNYAKNHREIISRFGRYPYRNKVLGRDSTEEELEWLKSFKGW